MWTGKSLLAPEITERSIFFIWPQYKRSELLYVKLSFKKDKSKICNILFMSLWGCTTQFRSSSPSQCCTSHTRLSLLPGNYGKMWKLDGLLCCVSSDLLLAGRNRPWKPRSHFTVKSVLFSANRNNAGWGGFWAVSVVCCRCYSPSLHWIPADVTQQSSYFDKSAACGSWSAPPEHTAVPQYVALWSHGVVLHLPVNNLTWNLCQ